MTLHHTSSAPKHVICRLLRSPLPLFSIVLLYLIYMFAFREGASLLSRGSNTLKSNVSLRGTAERDSQEEDTDGSLDERLSEDAQWEPDPEWTSAQRSVVKGGVEIYPVQVCVARAWLLSAVAQRGYTVLEKNIQLVNGYCCGV